MSRHIHGGAEASMMEVSTGNKEAAVFLAAWTDAFRLAGRRRRRRRTSQRG
jgi:hypothetical protein